MLFLYYNERKNIVAYVSAYGNYGAERVVFFDIGDLSISQWDTLGELPDHDKLLYVNAILNKESTKKWED
jgi:DUF971 family protein